MFESMVDIQSATAENRRRKNKKIETTAAKYNGLPYWAAIITPIAYAGMVCVFVGRDNGRQRVHIRQQPAVPREVD